jgi:hypothetical protein
MLIVESKILIQNRTRKGSREGAEVGGKEHSKGRGTTG